MIPGVIYLMVSFFLDGLLTMVVPMNSLARPLFSFLSIFFLFPLFQYHKKPYYLLVFILGVCYDLVYTNTGFFHGLLFLGFGYWIMLWNKYFHLTAWNVLWMSVVLIFGYRLVSYLLLVFLQVLPFQFSFAFLVLKGSFLLNFIYVGISFLFLPWLSHKKANS